MLVVFKVWFILAFIGDAFSATLPDITKVHATEIGKDYVKLAWEYNPSALSVIDYHVQVIYRIFDPTVERSVKQQSLKKGSMGTTIFELRSGTPYQIFVNALSNNVTRTFWEEGRVIKTSGVRPPRTFDVREISDKTATMTWTPPLSTSTLPDDYQIFIQNRVTKKITEYPAVAHPTNEFVAWHLEPNTTYVAFIVSRKNAEPSTNMSMWFRTNSPIVLSTNVKSIKETSVHIEWETQLYREQIARYGIEIRDTSIVDKKKGTKIYRSPGNQEVRFIDITDLKPGTTYTYRVRAVYRRNGGKGTWTKIKYFTTIRTDPPPVPTQGKIIETGMTSAKLIWTAPTYKYKITEYEIEYAKWQTRPFPTAKTSNNNPTYLLGDLESGTEYNIRVRAISEHGMIGAWSTKKVFRTLGPQPVSSVSITEIKSTSAVISWIMYTNTTADKIKVSVIQNSDTSSETKERIHFFPGNQTRFVANRLESFTPYAVQVYVILNGQTSSAKENGLRTAGSIDVAAQRPTNPKVLEREDVQSLSVLYFEFDKIPNSIVKHYVLKIQGFNVPNIPFSRTQVVVPGVGGKRQRVQIKDVQSGYKYKIRALGVFYGDSEGKWSTAVGTIIPGPRPVTALGMKTITDKDVTVAWESGYNLNDDLYSQQEYIITLSQFAEDNKIKVVATRVVPAPQTEYTFHSALDSLERYQIEIVTQISSLSVKKSTPKQRGFKADSENLKTPRMLKVTRNPKSFTFRWERIPNREDIKRYEIEFEASSSTVSQKIATTNGQVDSYTFENLKEDETYIFKVRAVDMNGEKSDWLSKAVNLKYGLSNGIKEVHVLRVTGHYALLSWDVPLTTDIKMFEIQMRSLQHNDVKNIVTKVLTSKFKVEDLHDGTIYQFRVRAIGIDENEKGPWTDYQTFTTETKSTESSFSTGIIAGIVIAAIIVLILLIVLIVICKKRSRTSNNKAFNVRFSRNGNGIKEIA